MSYIYSFVHTFKEFSQQTVLHGILHSDIRNVYAAGRFQTTQVIILP